MSNWVIDCQKVCKTYQDGGLNVDVLHDLTLQIQAGESVQLLARPYADWPLSRILELIDSQNCQPQAMREVLQLPLPTSWQHMFQRRLDTGECEDWQRRLFG